MDEKKTGGNEESVKRRRGRERRETDSFPISQIHDPHPGKLPWRWCLFARLTGVDKMAWKILRTQCSREGEGVAAHQTDGKSERGFRNKAAFLVTRPYLHRVLFASIEKKRKRKEKRKRSQCKIRKFHHFRCYYHRTLTSLTINSRFETRRSDSILRIPSDSDHLACLSRVTSITNDVGS